MSIIAIASLFISFSLSASDTETGVDKENIKLSCPLPWENSSGKTQTYWKTELENNQFAFLVGEYLRRGLGLSHWYVIDAKCEIMAHWESPQSTSFPKEHKIVQDDSHVIYWAYEYIEDAQTGYPIYNKYYPRIDRLQWKNGELSIDTLLDWKEVGKSVWGRSPYDGQWLDIKLSDDSLLLKAQVVLYKAKSSIERHAQIGLKMRGAELKRREFTIDLENIEIQD